MDIQEIEILSRLNVNLELTESSRWTSVTAWKVQIKGRRRPLPPVGVFAPKGTIERRGRDAGLYFRGWDKSDKAADWKTRFPSTDRRKPRLSLPLSVIFITDLVRAQIFLFRGTLLIPHYNPHCEIFPKKRETEKICYLIVNM